MKVCAWHRLHSLHTVPQIGSATPEAMSHIWTVLLLSLFFAAATTASARILQQQTNGFQAAGSSSELADVLKGANTIFNISTFILFWEAAGEQVIQILLLASLAATAADFAWHASAALPRWTNAIIALTNSASRVTASASTALPHYACSCMSAWMRICT